MRRVSGVRVDAEQLELRTAQGTVFSDLDLTVPSGGLTALRTNSGGGRTACLLTLSGRMRPSAGSLRVGGYELPRHARRVRAFASLALCSGVNDLDERMRVAEHLRERLLLRLRPASRSLTQPALWQAGLDELDTTRLIADLSTTEKRQLGLALALLDEPRLVLVDHVDDGLALPQQRRIWHVLRALANSGVTVIATCADGDAASEMAEVVPLPSRDAASVRETRKDVFS